MLTILRCRRMNDSSVIVYNTNRFSRGIPARRRNAPHRRNMSVACAIDYKEMLLHYRYDTASCAPARRDVDRVIRPLARSFRRVASPGQYALSL